MVPVPASVGNGVQLHSVTAVSAIRAWAVGSDTAGGAYREVILRWNGATWSRAALPASAPHGDLLGVAANSPSNAWAVGQSTDSTGGCSSHCNTVIWHWNGCMWTRVPSPNPPGGYLNALFDVAIVANRDVWAGGTTDYSDTLIAHWNGTSWS